MTDKLREAAQQALEALKETSVECAIEILEAALAQQDAQAVPQPPMLRWRELADYPAGTGRYIVAHCGQVGGHAYYTAREGDTHYPVGWAQLPDFKPTHWLDGPRIGTGDAALNAAPTPPAQQDAQAAPTQRQYELALGQWESWKAYALELQAKLVKYEGGSPMVLNAATAPPAQAVLQEPCAVVKWQTGGPVVHIIGEVQVGDLLYRAAPTPPAQQDAREEPK